MATTRTTLKKPRVSLDRSIEHLRKQLADLAPYLGKGNMRSWARRPDW